MAKEYCYALVDGAVAQLGIKPSTLCVVLVNTALLASAGASQEERHSKFLVLFSFHKGFNFPIVVASFLGKEESSASQAETPNPNP